MKQSLQSLTLVVCWQIVWFQSIQGLVSLHSSYDYDTHLSVAVDRPLTYFGFYGTKIENGGHFFSRTNFCTFLVSFPCDTSFLLPLRTTWYDTRFLASKPCAISHACLLIYVKTMWFHRHEWIGICRSHAQICDYWLVLIFGEFWIT